MQHKRLIVVIAFGALFTVGLSAETLLTTEKAVELAIKNNLSLQRTKITTDAKKRAEDRSWNALLPSLSANAGAARSNSDKLSGSNDWTPSGTASASITISPSIVAGMEKLKLDYESGVIDYDAAKRSLELSTREAFNQILLYKATIDINRQKLETAKSQYEQTTARAKIGQVPQLDALSAQVDWETLKPTLESSIVNYESALDDFKRILGLPLDGSIVLDGDLVTEASPQLVAKADPIGESMDVVSLRKSLEITAATKKVVRDEALMPYLALSFSTSPTYSSTLEDWYDAGSFSAAVGIKLDGFVPGSSIRESLDQYDDSIKSISNQIQEAQLTSQTSIRQLKRSIEKSFTSLEVQKLNVELAERSYALYEEAYKKGSTDLQSLKAARDTLEGARLSVMQEYYTLANSILELENELNMPFGQLGQY